MKNLSLLVFISTILISCNKYEDGPSVSFRSAEKRLTGKWEVSQILFNEKDISAGYFSSNLNDFPVNIYSDWSKDYFIGISHTNGDVIAKSDLVLNKNKTAITFGLLEQPSYESDAGEIFCIIPPLRDIIEWKILRLKNDELWITTNFDTNNFELHFNLLADFSDY